MAFTVQGYIDGVSYAVEVGGETVPREGIAGGSPSALGVLRDHEGTDVLVSPVGPSITADLSTPEGVLAVLTAHTEVTSVDGDDVPNLLGVSREDVDY